jgi:hypothetical protein
VGVEHVAETALDVFHLRLPVFYHLQSLNMINLYFINYPPGRRILI